MQRIQRGAASLCAIVALGANASPAQEAPTAEELLADLPFSEGEKQRIRNGELVTGTTEVTSDRELAVTMAFLVQEPTPAIVATFREADSYHGDPMVTGFGAIRGEGTLADFSGVELEPNGEEAAQAFLNAEPGSALNLDAAEIEALRALGGQSPAKPRVEEQLRRMLLARYQAYRQGGLAGIAPYVRRGGKKFEPAGDLRKGTEANQLLAKYARPLYDLLLQYPSSKPPGLEEEFFWINFRIDDTPTFVLSHRVAVPFGDGYALADRHYYVSRSHNTVQAVGLVLPVKQGTGVAYLNRTSTDQVAGFGSGTKQAVGRRVMGRKIAETFEKLRTQAAQD